MRLWEIDLAVIVVASACCLAIGIILLLALGRTRQLRRNRLALVTAALLIALGLGDAGRALRYLGLLGNVQSHMRADADWWRLTGDLVIAAAAAGYWLLRPSSGAPHGIGLFSDLHARDRQAFLLSDEIVQGLASIAYALELGKTELAAEHTQATLIGGPGARARPGGDCAASAGGAGARSPGRAANPTRMITLLLVDDSIEIRALVAEAMEIDGRFRVVGQAGTGLEAIDRAEQLRPDAVVLDLAMPGLDGLTVLPRLRKLLPRAAIVCLSGMSARWFESAALAAGADSYLEKGSSLWLLADELAAAHAAHAV